MHGLDHARRARFAQSSERRARVAGTLHPGGIIVLYRCQDVADVADLYAGTEEPALGDARLVDLIQERARLLARGVRESHPGAAVVRRNFPTPALDPGLEADAAELVARSLWFTTLEEVPAEARLDPHFERAAEAVVNGDLSRLRRLVEDMPQLVFARSPYGHRAALLHYVGANGVQIRRQTVSSRTVTIAGLLLARGARVGATMRVYGGQHTVVDMVRTSAHPHEAGIAAELLAVLDRG